MKKRTQKFQTQPASPELAEVPLSKSQLMRRVAAHIKSTLANEVLLEERAVRCIARLSDAKLILPTPSTAPKNSKQDSVRGKGYGASGLRPLLCLALLQFLGASASAQDITIIKEGVGNKAIPVALSGITGEAAQVIQFDLFVQGFTFTSPEAAQYVISGSASGDIKGTLVDQVTKQTRLSRAYSGVPLRRQAHAFANDIVEAVTGKKGIGLTKIAYKADSGRNSEIYISDFDGANAQSVTRDNTIVAAPTWVPGRLAVYYTSYKLGNPDIFFQDLSSGQRKAIARYSGLNTAAAVSPDGSRVAMILSKGGSPDVYVSNAEGGGLQQLTKTREDESSPCWSPDGQWICFAGKKSERRALWKVSPSGGTPQAISTAGVRNPSEPEWSPDGKWIVFTAQMGDFNICVIPSGGGTATVLTSGEDPSWAPNSRTIIFARRSGGRRSLAMLDMPTKQVKELPGSSGGNSQPHWAK